MSFRFQKRIKLGKGLGINVSKSGISPSYRTKKGSISSKGYSVRSGISGLTYRKTFNKAKNDGCLVGLLLLFFMTSSVLFISCNTEKQKMETKWYQGGTLHKSKINDWKNATEENKLATCGDFCANTYNDNSIDEIKIIATNLKICIDEAIQDHSYLDSNDVSKVASMCLLLMENLN